MTNDKDTGLKWLSIDAIHAHCRIDFNCEDAELEQMGITAEQAILNLTRRTFENFIDTYGRIPDPIFNASLLLVQNLYNNRDAADSQKKETRLRPSAEELHVSLRRHTSPGGARWSVG